MPLELHRKDCVWRRAWRTREQKIEGQTNDHLQTLRQLESGTDDVLHSLRAAHRKHEVQLAAPHHLRGSAFHLGDSLARRSVVNG